MLSIGRRKQTPSEQQTSTGPLPMPGLAQQYSPAEQSSSSSPASLTSEGMPSSQQAVQPYFPASVSPVAVPFDGSMVATPVTGQLVDVQTGNVPAISDGIATSPQRQPTVIRSTGKKSAGTLLAPKPQGKRTGVHMSVGVLLILMVVLGLVAVLPGGIAGHANGFNLFNPPWNMAGSKSGNTALVSAQVATATAVTQDGYDAGNQTYAGVSSVALNGAGGDPFAAGQCTYWADYRYHQLTGYWVPWSGNAYQWYAGAIASGWSTSTVPHVPSIVVLAPGVQGASSAYGHVALVESINADGSAYVSQWNWAGNWGVTTYWTFYPGAGVHFVWHP